jgi:hypothetical protein
VPYQVDHRCLARGVATTRLLRLWQETVAQLGSACLGLRMADHWQPGSLHVADYLFLTAATLRKALAMIAPYERLLNDTGSTISY